MNTVNPVWIYCTRGGLDLFSAVVVDPSKPALAKIGKEDLLLSHPFCRNNFCGVFRESRMRGHFHSVDMIVRLAGNSYKECVLLARFTCMDMGREDQTPWKHMFPVSSAPLIRS